MEINQIRKVISFAMLGLFISLILMIAVSILAIESTKKSPKEIAAELEKQKVQMERLAQGKSLNENLPDIWPPKMNQPYPSFDLIDQKGGAFKISDYTGKILIVEYIDMSSPVSQAQSGAGLVGTYGVGGTVDQFALPIEDVLRTETQGVVSLPNDKVMQVKVIVYGESGGQASRDDAQNWAEHFKFTKAEGVIVAVPVKNITGDETNTILGGYQLIDANNFLRVDSSGPIPKHNLKMTFAPMVQKLTR